MSGAVREWKGVCSRSMREAESTPNRRLSESRAWHQSHVHATGADSGQLPPAGHAVEHTDLLHRALGREPAAGDQHDLRPPIDDLFPPQRHRLVTLATETVLAAGEPHELGIPVTGGEG